MIEYKVSFSDFPYPHYFYKLQDAIKDGVSRANDRNYVTLYRNGEFVAYWSNGNVTLLDKRKNLQKAFEHFELNSALTLDAVNKEIKSIAEHYEIKLVENGFFKDKGLLTVKFDASDLVTVEISKNHETAKDVDGWTIYELIINPHIRRTLSKATPQELYQVAEQIKKMARFAEILITKKMKLKIKNA